MIRSICMGTMCAAALLLFATGCDSQKTQPNPVNKTEPEHHHHGPNEGELYELVGDGHYHAELLQKIDDKTVTVFLLGEDEKTPVTTAANELIIRITLDGKPTPFSLAATPNTGETAGNVSKFESKDELLISALAHKTADREIEVKIADKPYKAKFEYYEPHDHGHADDEHKDEHKDDHKHDEKDKDAKP
jgi:hypothetical protein